MNRREPTELRYADMPWGRELDEVIGHVHLEDCGGHIAAVFDDCVVSVGVVRLPRMLWWEEIREAWIERRWPCFWVPRLVLQDAWGPLRNTPEWLASLERDGFRVHRGGVASAANESGESGTTNRRGRLNECARGGQE